MDIVREKQKIFGSIAALRVSTEGYPKFSLENSLPSINVNTNSLDFLTDLIKSLIGFEALKDTVVEALTQNLDEVEEEVKKALKRALKSLVSCSVDPSMPDFFITDGIRLSLDDIDYLDILKIDPESTPGKLIYNDVFAQSESTDFNTFLFNTIQDNGTSGFWGHVTFDADILDIAFDDIAPDQFTDNNTILVKPAGEYSSGSKKLTDLNNDYIDSIKLFEASKLINTIIDSIFGSISAFIRRDADSIEREMLIEDIINNVLSADEEIVIDDSFFSFSNEEIQNRKERARLRSKGIKILVNCDEVQASIPIEELTTVNDELDELNLSSPSAELNEIITSVIRTGLDNLAESSVDDVSDENKATGKLSFIEEFLKKLMTAIVNVVLSPKLIIILAINHKIIYGEDFKDVVDFMKKNKSLLSAVLNTVRDTIVSILMAKALKEIKKLVAANTIKVYTERLKNNRAQLASLVGIPNEIVRKIAGLIKT